MSGRTLDSWTQIKLSDELVESEARAQIQRQVQSLIRDISSPWRTVKLTPQPVETMVIDALQQELIQLNDAPHSDWHHTVCMKCLRALCKARNAVPSSLFLRDVTREEGFPIAGGGFADIWKGRRHGTQVCLKVLRVFGMEEQRAKVLQYFCQEALVWRQLRHPNVLPFLGVSKELFVPTYCLISPWMVNGNIISYLEVHPDHDRLTSLVQVAEGMKYLHNQNPPIVHADIRGANILVMDDLRCCLADFGLSLFAESQVLESSSRMNKGSTRWLAPEYIDPKVAIDWAYITARDIYAYGCTIVEILTGKPPFSEIKNEAAVIHAVMNGDRPLPPQHLPQDGLRSLVMACFTASPSQRPTAEQISKILADGDFLADCLSFRDGTLTRGNIDAIDAYNSVPVIDLDTAFLSSLCTDNNASYYPETPNTYDSFSSGAQSDVSPAQPDFSSFLYPSPSETYSYDYTPRASTIEYRSPASFIPETNPAMVDDAIDYYLSTNLPNEYLNDLMDFSFPSQVLRTGRASR